VIDIRPASSIHPNSHVLAVGRPYVERLEREPGWHDRAAEFLLAAAMKPIRAWVSDPGRALSSIVEHVDRHERSFRLSGDADLVAAARGMRARLRRSKLTPPLVGESFALVREAAIRTIGQRHYDTQLMAGWALLQGKLVEMETGEGKTIAATLPASVVALAGYPVHIITVNDYLAKRDANEMGSLYRFLGLDVGVIVQGMSRIERRQAYGSAVTYCTNKELAFDYLRDRIALGRRHSRLHLALEKLHSDAGRNNEMTLRGLYFAIVDEADSVLIDEARTPLILSSSVSATEEKRSCEEALGFARSLVPGGDFEADLANRSISLTPHGRAALADFAGGRDGVWTSMRAAEELATQALTALVLFRRDVDYVVNAGKVQIVDESTGRVMPDRSWERGLHQLIEVKESCEPTQRRETIARLTYQRLFRRFVRLAGMTGTAKEVAREIRSVYGLDVVRIPLHRPSQRKYTPTRVYATRAEKWQEVVACVERLSSTGRPVLVGTRSVGASEEISRALNARGIDHALLNAKQDQQEASIIASAGQPSRVTVATNMAGRGTDIRLGRGVAERGGLHVILTEFHEARRIDRQLFGRCARQGDPGTCEAIASLEDELYSVYAPLATRLVKNFCGIHPRTLLAAFHLLRLLAQLSAEHRASQLRAQNLKLDRRFDQVLAFSGRGD
jgi:preprotein translocase subunit SecA